MIRKSRGARAALALAGCAIWITVLAACTSGPEATPLPTATPTATPEPGTPGVTDERILFGQSAALTGPAGDLGQEVRKGIRAAFAERNAQGGVHGRMLELETLDDGYEPDRAVANTRELLEERDVFALIGAVGTPTSLKAAPLALESGAPYIAPFTGAAFLRGEGMTNVLNLRASYAQEVALMVDRLVGDLGVKRIAVMYQNDGYGRDGYNGVLQALAALEPRLELVAVGTYERNTVAVKRGILNLLLGDPEAVIVIGAYEPVASILHWSALTGPDAVFLTVSFVGVESLARALSSDLEIYVTQVVPDPADASTPVVGSYQRALRAYDAGAVPGYVSLEGYLMGRLAIYAAELCGRDIDRECFVRGVREGGDFDIDGFRLSYDDASWDNQGSGEVYLTLLDGEGNLRQVDSLEDANPVWEIGSPTAGGTDSEP